MEKNIYNSMMKELSSVDIKNWEDIFTFINTLKNRNFTTDIGQTGSSNEIFKGIAFLTYDFGIDGVSVEIAKYAKSLEFQTEGKSIPDIHLIGGDFHKGSVSVILPRWKRFRLFGANGWNKWDKGKWFKRLYLDKWNLQSKEPDILAQNIWSMSLSLIERLGHYINQNQIDLFIPVNIFSNPGNFSFSLAVILAAEYFSIPILNSNHDFYWEGGKPENERKPGESSGIRDHFFKNHDHENFKKLFELIYPWDGKYSIQVNINKEQSAYLIDNKGFDPNRVFELSTSLSEKFFVEFSPAEKKKARLRMMNIFSNGDDVISPVNVKDSLKGLDEWMRKQKPFVCAIREGLTLDTTADTIYFLQPTRIIKRKRIEKDIIFIKDLLSIKGFSDYLKKNSDTKIIIHVTGPVPIEHSEAMKSLLNTFENLFKEIDKEFHERVFLGFSVGTEEHRIFLKKGFKKLSIEEIYSMADMVLFPSETEGRGLPIIESSAAGIPIICSRYSPEKVFKDVVGENLDKSLQINFIPFPDENSPKKIMKKIISFITNPQSLKDELGHNRKAVKQRFSTVSMKESFDSFKNILIDIIKKEA